MAQCPNCSNPIRKDPLTKIRSCRRHGPIKTLKQIVEDRALRGVTGLMDQRQCTGTH